MLSKTKADQKSKGAYVDNQLQPKANMMAHVAPNAIHSSVCPPFFTMSM
jgi:hypothetical protein